jgi:hypothetical protein
MKKPLFCAALCLVLLAPTLSLAGGDGWRGHSAHGYYGQARGYDRGHGGHGGHGGHRHGRGDRDLRWVPWASAIVIGSSLYWANQAYSQPTTTIIVTPPPPVVLEAPRVAYFCQSSRQYYPYVATCNMPWQLVPY